MSEALATSPAAAESSVVVIAGSLVFISFYDAQNKPVNTIGRVLAVNTLDEAGISEDGWPSLTILVPDPKATATQFSSARWYEAFLRMAGVRHVNHGAHDKGGTTAAWQELPLHDNEDFPELLEELDAPPPNPTFLRHGIEVDPEVSIEQSAAVQSGKAPSTSTASPLINEPEGTQLPLPEPEPAIVGETDPPAPQEPTAEAEGVEDKKPEAEQTS